MSSDKRLAMMREQILSTTIEEEHVYEFYANLFEDKKLAH